VAWLSLALLGAYHGLNPAMGWLFGVSLGLTERCGVALLQALPPIAIGHAASIALTVAAVSGLELVAAPRLLRLLAAAALILFGLYKFLRPRSHPRWVGMRVTPRELTLWSFLMASAHGAGLMLVPVLLRMPASEHVHHAMAATDAGGADVGAEIFSQSVAAVLVHTLAMMLVMTAVAVVVYEKLGLAMLRRAWINLDLLWAAAIVTAGVLTLFT
jgi:hypothetical protein